MSEATSTPAVPKLANEETCTHCSTGLGYPQTLHIDHPQRLGNYVEGGGQLCPACAERIYSRVAVAQPTFDIFG